VQISRLPIEKENPPALRLVRIDVAPHFCIKPLGKALRLAEKVEEAMGWQKLLQIISRSALPLYARLWGLLTHLRTLIDCGGDGLRWLGQSRHKCVDRGRSLVTGGGFWWLGKGYQGEDRAGRESCLGRATIAHGEGHTKIDGPAPMQPSDSPPGGQGPDKCAPRFNPSRTDY
jgi:hypothetical protein